MSDGDVSCAGEDDKDSGCGGSTIFEISYPTEPRDEEPDDKKILCFSIRSRRYYHDPYFGSTNIPVYSTRDEFIEFCCIGVLVTLIIAMIIVLLVKYVF